MRKAKNLFLVTVLHLVAASFVLGQASGTTGINGTVTDLQGGVVAGATVTLSNPTKGFTRTTVTNGSGVYNFAGILPDTYTMEVEKTGFKSMFEMI
jgi:protocatechuate 3,4-dioxygenase beta subunit